MTRFLHALAILALGAAVPGQAQTHLVVVSGLGGEPRFSELFRRWGTELVDAAARLGVPDSHVVFLAEDPSVDPRRITGRSTTEEVTRVLRNLAGRVSPDAFVMIVLLGHGSDRGEPRLSLPGPDLTGRNLSELIGTLRAGRVAVINAASASGGFVAALSAPGRIVVTATKSGFEQNHALFGGYFVEAFRGTNADTDKDQRVSLLEAFQYARESVRRWYENEKQLLTEHALLDDNGDGAGSEAPDGSGGDGMLAAAAFLAPASAAVTGVADPELRALVDRKAALERQIADLRARRAGMSAEAYDRQLEDLLVALAGVDQQIRERQP